MLLQDKQYGEVGGLMYGLTTIYGSSKKTTPEHASGLVSSHKYRTWTGLCSNYNGSMWYANQRCSLVIIKGRRGVSLAIIEGRRDVSLVIIEGRRGCSLAIVERRRGWSFKKDAFELTGGLRVLVDSYLGSL